MLLQGKNLKRSETAKDYLYSHN